MNSPCILSFFFLIRRSFGLDLENLRKYSNKGTQGLQFGRESFDFTNSVIP
jgi:hypothetical protein